MRTFKHIIICLALCTFASCKSSFEGVDENLPFIDPAFATFVDQFYRIADERGYNLPSKESLNISFVPDLGEFCEEGTIFTVLLPPLE